MGHRMTEMGQFDILTIANLPIRRRLYTSLDSRVGVTKNNVFAFLTSRSKLGTLFSEFFERSLNETSFLWLILRVNQGLEKLISFRDKSHPPERIW